MNCAYFFGANAAFWKASPTANPQIFAKPPISPAIIPAQSPSCADAIMECDAPHTKSRTHLPTYILPIFAISPDLVACPTSSSPPSTSPPIPHRAPTCHLSQCQHRALHPKPSFPQPSSLPFPCPPPPPPPRPPHAPAQPASPAAPKPPAGAGPTRPTASAWPRPAPALPSVALSTP